jgi:thioredoxin 2
VSAHGHPRCAECHADLPWIVDAGDSSFARATDTTQLVVVDLWADWCGPCRMIAPSLATLAHEFAGRLKVVKVDVDANPDTAYRFNARSIPLLVLLRQGRVVDQVVGAQPLRTLRTVVERHL